LLKLIAAYSLRAKIAFEAGIKVMVSLLVAGAAKCLQIANVILPPASKEG
jgi:hypothetical protein